MFTNLDPDFRTLLVAFLSALIPIVVAFLSGLAGLLMIEARRLLAEKVGQERAGTIEHYVRLGIFAAEQYLKGEEGQAKKVWALNWIQLQLKMRGIEADVPQIAELIEAFVGQEKFNLEAVHTMDIEELMAKVQIDADGGLNLSGPRADPAKG